jgi:hypothetical protein
MPGLSSWQDRHFLVSSEILSSAATTGTDTNSASAASVATDNNTLFYILLTPQYRMAGGRPGKRISREMHPE